MATRNKITDAPQQNGYYFMWIWCEIPPHIKVFATTKWEIDNIKLRISQYWMKSVYLINRKLCISLKNDRGKKFHNVRKCSHVKVHVHEIRNLYVEVYLESLIKSHFILNLFMPPRSKIGVILFLSFLPFQDSVILCETFLITFNSRC